MQARYYDPVIGRFLSKDPVGFAEGGVGYFNRYAYVMNDPVNKTDPTGMCPPCIGAILGGGADFVVQLHQNGWDVSKVDGRRVLGSAAFGAVGGMAGYFGKAAVTGRGFSSVKNLSGTQRAIVGGHAAALGAAVGDGVARLQGHHNGFDAIKGGINALTNGVGGTVLDKLLGLGSSEQEEAGNDGLVINVSEGLPTPDMNDQALEMGNISEVEHQQNATKWEISGGQITGMRASGTRIKRDDE